MKNRQQALRFSFGILFLVFLMLFLPKEVNADGTTLSISPSVIQIQAKPPADVWTPFTISNNTNQPVSLKVGYKPFDPQASSNGNVVFVNDDQNITGQDKKIFEKMQIVDDQNISHDTIDIGPKQELRFRLHIVLPAQEPSSDYYFSLIFLQSASPIDQNIAKADKKIQQSSSSIQAGIGLNVLLAVGDKEAPLGSIDKFTAPWFLNNGPVSFVLSLHNSGTHFINPHGVILIKNIFGQTVGKVPVPPSIILEDTSRNFISTISQRNASTTILDTSNSQIDGKGLIWPESFLLGMYTATLTLTLSDNGPVYVRTIHFIAFPIAILLQILLVMCGIIYIYLRIKRRLS